MYYERHYMMYGCKNPNFKDFLERNYGIPCRKTTAVQDPSSFAYYFNVPENHPRFAEIEQFLPPIDKTTYEPIVTNPQEKVFVYYTQEYNEQELSSAKWLSVRSSFSKVDPDNDTYIYSCFSHRLRDVDVYHHSYLGGHYLVSRPVKWGNRFFASGPGECDLFCNQFAKKIMEQNGFQGLEYESVRHISTGQIMPNIYRMNALQSLPDQAVVCTSDMDTGVCDKCGMKLLGYKNTRGTFGLVSSFLDDSVDFYRTLPMFTPSLKEKYMDTCSCRLIVSQRFYQMVKEKKMDRALFFTPLELSQDRGPRQGTVLREP